MAQLSRQRGVARPLWLAMAVVSCVVFGSTLNRCLTCGAPIQEPAEVPPPVEGAYLSLTWETLTSYVYEFPEVDETRPLKDQIPDRIKKFAGRRVAIRGFMMPVELDGEDISEFLLLRNQAWCCFGQMPQMNEWVHVRMMKGKTAPFVADVPMTIFGTLEVGEVVEDGIVMSIYRIECEDVTEPPVFR